MGDRLAVYTTVYPAMEKYLTEWYKSVQMQTDDNFDLWISLDMLSVSRVVSLLGVEPRATWVIAAEGDSPAQVRERAIKQMIDQYPAVIFVDSDDLLHPSRVESARRAIAKHDVAGCALNIMDEQGNDLGVVFGPEAGEDATGMLPRHNVFGLSNTAYRSVVLRKCLPVMKECLLIDWLFATRAWMMDAKMWFDPVPRMSYRQYSTNVARVLYPFSASDVMKATERVRIHYTCVLADESKLALDRKHLIKDASTRVEQFYQSIYSSSVTLDKYVTQLNQLPPRYVWWWSVANPALEDTWKN